MNPQESSLGTDLQAGFNHAAEGSGGSPGAQGGQENLNKPANPDNTAWIDAERRAARAEARLEFEKEHAEKSKEQPKTDILQEAIDSLPDDEKEAASKFKPLFEKMMASQKDGVMTKAEVEKLLAQHSDDSKHIAHLELWKKEMATEWNGADGKPKFEWDKIEKFMTEKELKDPQDAFYLLNKDSIIKYSASLSPAKPKQVDRGGRSAPAPGYEPPKDKNEARSRMQERGAERLAQYGL